MLLLFPEIEIKLNNKDWAYIERAHGPIKRKSEIKSIVLNIFKKMAKNRRFKLLIYRLIKKNLNF